jgi:hypothetical protein
LCVTDIVPIVKGASTRLFSNAKNARKAIAKRGWGPALNFCLLLDTQLSQRPKDSPINQPTDASSTSVSASTNNNSGIVTLSFNMTKG